MICPHCQKRIVREGKRTRQRVKFLLERRSKKLQDRIQEISFKTKNLDYDELYEFLKSVENIPEEWILKVSNDTWGQYRDKKKPFKYLLAIIRNKIEEERKIQ